jgi:uncharacterized membrane protein
MEASAKVLGHAVHPMLIPYPLALLTTAIIFDVIRLVSSNSLWSTIAFWMIVAGIIGGELIGRHGLAVDDGANLNSPSSLSGRPASETAQRSVSR